MRENMSYANMCYLSIADRAYYSATYHAKDAQL